MKRNLTLWIVLGIVLLMVAVGGCSYNGLVREDESVKNTWDKVKSDYKRRADLIPNFVSTVKGAARFEQETYTQVALARGGRLKQVSNVPADSLTPQKFQEIETAGNESAAANRAAINILVESYPDLKATSNFTELQKVLEGTENRIGVARKDFIDAVKTYNIKVRSFPTNFLAGVFGFKPRPELEVSDEDMKTPKVEL